jgi:hypothetical protein
MPVRLRQANGSGRDFEAASHSRPQQLANAPDETVESNATETTAHQLDRRRAKYSTRQRKGKAMTDLVDAARNRIGRAIFETWDVHDIDELVRLMRKFADAVKDDPPGA